MRVITSIPRGFLLILAISMIYLVLAARQFFERKNYRPLGLLEGKTFTIYLLSWPFQAIVVVLLSKIFHLNWYIEFIQCLLWDLLCLCLSIYWQENFPILSGVILGLLG